jgi:integrase
MAVGDIGTAAVRQWRTRLLDGGMSGNRAAKVYRLLRAILYTAVDDGMIKRNPCRIKGADKETEHARPVATVQQVYALADAVPPRFRVLVLLGAFTSLRWGELVNVRRVNIDSNTGAVEVSDTLSERDDGTLDDGSTKSDAGRRTVATHLAEFTEPELDALVFLGENGGRLRRSNFRRAAHWAATVGKVGHQPSSTWPVSAGGVEGNRTPNPRLAKVAQGARSEFLRWVGGSVMSVRDRDDLGGVARFWHDQGP